jgi:leader peptidase (prepilin peptidase)/N-methyltransferase
MLEIIALLSLIGGLVTLYALSSIDLKIGLLPNELVLGLFALGMVFHLSNVFAYLGVEEMVIGAVIGGSILYIIRGVAGLFYQEDALGLGDVKLMIAAGVWLGPYYILIALTLGALLGIMHGLCFVLYYRIKSKASIPLGTLTLPAGPGFSGGIILTALYFFRDFPFRILETF